MNLIEIDLIKIDIKPYRNQVYVESLVKNKLRMPFILGYSSLNKVIRYTVTKVENFNHIYEFLPNRNKIKVISKSSDTFETEEIITFRAKSTCEFVFPKVLKVDKKLFGLNEIEKIVIKHLYEEGNSATCLHGQRGNGKRLLSKKLEDICDDKHFFYLKKLPHQNYEKELAKLLDAIKRIKKSAVLVMNNIDYLNGDSINMMVIHGHLNEILQNRNVDVKILLTAENIKLINKSIRELNFSGIYVPSFNETDRMSFVKHLINKMTGREIFEEGFEELIEQFRGYSASEMEIFISKASIIFPELQLEKLKECFKTDGFIPTRLKGLVEDVEPLYWSDIGGYENVKLQLKRKFQLPIRHGLPIPKGILLYGPPGCSKTMFARAFATECQLKLISINPSSVMRGIVGESETVLRSAISHALALSPSIIFIDEIDTLIPKRTSKIKSSVGEHLLTEIITFLDGLETKKNQSVILMGATNRLDCVDEALIRTGRMNLLIEVGLPDQEARKSILKIVFSDQNYKIEEDIIERIPDIAKLLENKSGAEIVDVGKRIKKLSERKRVGDSIPTITAEHISEILPDLHYLTDKMNSLAL